MTISHTDNKDTRNENPLEIVNQKETGKAALSLDVDYYQSFLDDTDIPNNKKQELIETIWSIVTGFVDFGFGIHPVQHAHGEPTSQQEQHLTSVIREMIKQEEDSTQHTKVTNNKKAQAHDD